MNKFLKALSFLVSLLVLFNISFIDINLGLQYYLILLIVFLIVFLFKSSKKVNGLMFMLIIVSLFSILLNIVPAFFKPFERLFAFVIVLLLVSPLVRSKYLDFFRLKLFHIINLLIVCMVLASLIGLLTGIYTGKSGRSDFTGLFTHSMVLGPMAGISLLHSIYFFYKSKQKFRKILWAIAASMSFITCVAAGSRSALIASALGLLFFIFKIYQGSYTRGIKIMMILIALLVLSFPLWEEQSQFLQQKFEYSKQENDFTASRTSLWEERVLEFRESPIYGIGFATVDTEISDSFEIESGKIEPGSSWLAILSMTGLLGFFAIVTIILKHLKFLYFFRFNKQFFAMLGALLFFFIVHMFAEGYVFSAGSGLSFYFWLLLGVLASSKELSLKYIKTLKIS